MGPQGDVGPAGPRGLQGEIGPQGPQGKQGPRGYPASVNGIDPDSEGNIVLTPPVIGAASNTNLLDNWYFADPVNQRGMTEYTGAVYTIDRFYSTGPLVVTVEPNGLKIYNPTKSTHYVIQREEVKFLDELIGRIATISVLYICDNPAVNAYVGCLSLSSYETFFRTDYFFTDGKIHLASVSGLIRTVSEASSFEPFGLEVPPGATVKLMAAKLELGPRQTLAHKEGEAWVLNDPTPDKALELLKCQRYFNRIEIAQGITNTSTQYIPVFLHYTNMRCTPHVAVHGNITDGGGTPLTATVLSTLFTSNSASYIKLSKQINGAVIFNDLWLDANL